jgi:hypothetical protein
MYVQRQRKNLRPCLGFQRQHSKVVKCTLRRLRLSKRFDGVYKLMFDALHISYKISSIQDCVAQAMLATSPKLPRSPYPWEIHLDPFPDHLFPQIRSFKRIIAKRQRIDHMEPINWQAGIRPDHPFEPVRNTVFFSIPRPVPPPPPQQPRRQRKIPTQYYLEQAPFYAENFGPDPYANKPETVQHGPLKVLVLKLITTLSKLTIPGLNILAPLVFGLLRLGRFLASWILRFPFKRGCTFIANMEWEALVAIVLANQIAKILPGLGGEVIMDSGESDGPVYTVFVGARRAIGNGPVMPGSF